LQPFKRWHLKFETGDNEWKNAHMRYLDEDQWTTAKKIDLGIKPYQD
jgi:hypothetical protein